MANDMMVKELEQVVVRFSGDSGDGMQLAGNIFSTVSATVAMTSVHSPTIRQTSAPRKAHLPAFPVSRYISVLRKSIPRVTNATYW